MRKYINYGLIEQKQQNSGFQFPSPLKCRTFFFHCFRCHYWTWCLQITFVVSIRATDILLVATCHTLTYSVSDAHCLDWIIATLTVAGDAYDKMIYYLFRFLYHYWCVTANIFWSVVNLQPFFSKEPSQQDLPDTNKPEETYYTQRYHQHRPSLWHIRQCGIHR